MKKKTVLLHLFHRKYLPAAAPGRGGGCAYFMAFVDPIPPATMSSEGKLLVYFTEISFCTKFRFH